MGLEPLSNPETINGNVKKLSKRMKIGRDILLYLSFSSFKNLILLLITKVGEMEGVGTSLNSTSREK
jgi:hypothetical protein